MELLIGYLLFINLLTMVAYWTDKQKAKKNKWRISEKTLLFLTAIGGSAGALVGMFGFHHKTRHIKFLLGVPAFFALHVILLYYFVVG